MSLFEDAHNELEAKKREYQGQRRPLAPKQNRLRWVKITAEPQLFTVRSPLDWWYTHWDVGQRRARRCCGSACIPCAEGNPVGIRYVLAVEGVDGVVGLLELRERHSPFLELLNTAPDSQIGAVISVFRAWQAKNGPINLELVDRRTVIPVELTRVVATLGLPAQRSYAP